MFNRVYSYPEKHKCIYEHQYGFRKKHSAIHALMNITDTIRDALHNKAIAIGVFVDFQKAFDKSITVYFQILAGYYVGLCFIFYHVGYYSQVLIHCTWYCVTYSHELRNLKICFVGVSVNLTCPRCIGAWSH